MLRILVATVAQVKTEGFSRLQVAGYKPGYGRKKPTIFTLCV
jgi:hypothetical protein